MKAVLTAAGMLVALGASQSVAPLFPWSGAVFSPVAVALVLVAMFAGGRELMVVLPLAAIGEAWQSDRSIAVLLIGYVPLLPLGYWLEAQAPYQLPTAARGLVIVLFVAVWTRAVAGASIFATGAEFEPIVLMTRVILPGALLDAAVFALLYGAMRLMRLQPATLELEATFA